MIFCYPFHPYFSWPHDSRKVVNLRDPVVPPAKINNCAVRDVRKSPFALVNKFKSHVNRHLYFTPPVCAFLIEPMPLCDEEVPKVICASSCSTLSLASCVDALGL